MLNTCNENGRSVCLSSELVLFYDEPAITRSTHPKVFLGKVFWKHAANLQENIHAEKWFQ